MCNCVIFFFFFSKMLVAKKTKHLQEKNKEEYGRKRICYLYTLFPHLISDFPLISVHLNLNRKLKWIFYYFSPIQDRKKIQNVFQNDYLHFNIFLVRNSPGNMTNSSFLTYHNVFAHSWTVTYRLQTNAPLNNSFLPSLLIHMCKNIHDIPKYQDSVSIQG